MRVLSSPHSARAVAALTAVAVAASAGVALAPSANAYAGSEATVKAAVLTSAKIAAASGWNNTASPLSSSLTRQYKNDFINTVTPATLGDAQVAPESSELVVLGSPAERDSVFVEIRRGFGSAASSVAVNAATEYTIDAYTAADGPYPAIFEGVSLRKAGSDGLAIGVCLATASTTTTALQRTTCASKVSNAQAGAWAAISPTLVWRSTAAVKAKLLTAAAARKATKAPKGTKTKIVSTKSKNVPLGGRQVIRAYKNTGKGVRFSGPAATSITQYGNRINGADAFTKSKAGDKSLFGKLYDVKSDRYTVYVSAKRGGKTYRYAATVVRYSDVVIATSCEGNPSKAPSATALRTCSKRLAAAELARSKSLFSAIK